MQDGLVHRILEGHLSHRNFLRHCNCPKIHSHQQMQKKITCFFVVSAKEDIAIVLKYISTHKCKKTPLNFLLLSAKEDIDSVSQAFELATLRALKGYQPEGS